MIPVRLEITNFLPYRNPAPLDFDGIHVACLAGENGAGKSSLLEAMVWALWGRARDGKRSDDELIHFGEKEMRVAFIFDLENERFQVVRQRKSGKRGESLLVLDVYDAHTRSWRGLSEAGIRQTQRKINELLRIDYDTFMNSAFIAQGRADAFTVRAPGERKAVLANILGLDRWAVYEQQAKDRASGLREDLLLLKREIHAMDAELECRNDYEQDLSVAEDQLGKVAESLRLAERQMSDVKQAQHDISKSRSVIDDLKFRVQQGERELSDIDKERENVLSAGNQDVLESEREAVKMRLQALEGCESERTHLTKQHSEAVETSGRLKGENEILKAEADPINERIATLEAATEPVCPICGGELDDDARSHLLTELQSDLQTRRVRYTTNRTLQIELDDQASRLQDRLDTTDAGLKETSQLERRVAEIESAVASAKSAKQALGKLQQRQTRWSKRLAEDRGKLEKIQFEARELELQLRQADASQQSLDRLRFEHRIAIEQVGSCNQKLTSLEGLAERRKAKTPDLKVLSEKIGTLEELCVAFGKQGVPAMIIEAAVPEIEQIANTLLGKMTGGRMNVRFDTQRELKSGDVRETLDIKLSDELGTRNYELYSGGETFRVNFAIRIALSKLLARRSGAQLQTIVIDEGFGTQDTVGRERLIEAINAIQDDFKRVLVITHIEEMKDAFPTRINVVKTADGSIISID